MWYLNSPLLVKVELSGVVVVLVFCTDPGPVLVPTCTGEGVALATTLGEDIVPQERLAGEGPMPSTPLQVNVTGGSLRAFAKAWLGGPTMACH